MKKLIFSFILFILLFFFFNVEEINTIDDVALIYENDLNEEKYYYINFYNFNSKDIDKTFNNLNIKIISVKPFGYETVEYLNTNNLNEKYKLLVTENLFNESLIKINLNGFMIEKMLILCTKSELLKLENRVKII